jgi:hypothetical protein
MRFFEFNSRFPTEQAAIDIRYNGVLTRPALRSENQPVSNGAAKSLYPPFLR